MIQFFRYSLTLKSIHGNEVETNPMTYEEDEFLEYLDHGELPPFLIDLLETPGANGKSPGEDLWYEGCIIAEVRDYRQTADSCVYSTHHVLLQPTTQVNNYSRDHHFTLLAFS